MKQLRQFTSDFAELFAGNKDCYGIHVPAKSHKEGEKAKGASYTKNEPLAETLYLKHLHGETSLGVVPINKEGKVSFAAIDVDVYPLNPLRYLTMIRKSKLPFMGCKSKSGGMHLYCFFNPPAPASEVVPLMDSVRELLGLKLGTEIFPKQTILSQDSSGNWINLPYYKANDTTRFAYSIDGKELPLSTFLTMAMAGRTTTKALKAAIKAAPFAEAPPCLQRLYLQGGAEEGQFRDFMFQCGVYLKSRFGEAFPENLHLLNNNMAEPLDYAEIDKTIIASLNKKEYHYSCKSALLIEHCSKEICSTRKYGSGGQYVSDFEYGQLTRFAGDDDDEYYTWEVNSAVFTLYGIKDLISQDRFRALSGSKLNRIPNRLKDTVWLKIVNAALANVKEVDDDIGTGMSDKAHWTDKVDEFFSARRALRQEQLLDGLVFLKGRKLYFKTSLLQAHLLNVPTLRSVTKMMHRKMLSDYGISRGTVRIKGRPMSFNYVDLPDQHKKGRLLGVLSNPEREEKEEKEAKAKKVVDLSKVIDFKEKETF